MSDEVPPSVQAMSDGAYAPTAPLADFLVAYQADDNWWWRIACGHHQNLFEEAVSLLETAARMLDGDGPDDESVHARGVEDVYLPGDEAFGKASRIGYSLTYNDPPTEGPSE